MYHLYTNARTYTGFDLPSLLSTSFAGFNARKVVSATAFTVLGVANKMISIFLSLFKIFDVPVFWPILLLYFFALFFLTMKRQINHMRKHGYKPWSSGKKKYKNTGKEKLNKPSDL